MLTKEFCDRLNRLVEVGLTERRRELPRALSSIDAEFGARGAYHSGGRLLMIHRTVARELEVQAIIVWKSIVRVHQTLGAPIEDSLVTDLKQVFGTFMGSIRQELDSLLDKKITERQLRHQLTLDEAFADTHDKHNIEADLYVDSLHLRDVKRQHFSMGQTYNFYGAVGTVQTGPGAVANTVQNLGNEDKDAILQALNSVKAAIVDAREVADQRQELVEIADECSSQVQAANPNNSKLRAMFDVLASSIQTIATAQPAYQALKAALLPLGIMLP